MSENFEVWKDKFAWGSVAGVLLWNITASWMLFNRPDIDEVRHIVRTEAPYVADKELIREQMQQTAAVNAKLSVSIDRNTEAINLLRLEIVKVQNGGMARK